MTITQLKYVIAVAEHRNFTKAAEKTFVTQPTLSMQIQKLEEELDIQIFDRTKKPIELTSVGVEIVRQAKAIVNEAERMQDIVDQQKGFIGGSFQLGIIPTVMPTLLPMFLQTFTKRYPKVQLRIEELTTEEIISKLLEGHIDAGIAATPLLQDKIRERPLYYEPFVGYIPPSHRLHTNKGISTADLDIDDILLLEDGHCFRDGVINLCKAHKLSSTDSFQLESGSFETLIRLADEGLGMTLLPYLQTLTLPDKQLANLRYFDQPSPAREVSLVYSSSELKMQIIEAMYELITGVVRGAVKFQDVKIIPPTRTK